MPGEKSEFKDKTEDICNISHSFYKYMCMGQDKTLDKNSN